MAGDKDTAGLHSTEATAMRSPSRIALIGAALWCLAAAVPNAQGQACVDATGGILQLDYPVVQVNPSLQLNGMPFVTGEAQSVQIWLAQDGVLQVLLGETHLAPQPVNVIAGTYDLVYRDLTPDPAPLLPGNTWAVFESNVVIDTPGKLIANVVTSTLSGSLTLNGGPFPASTYEDANIYAVGTEGQGEVFLYNTSQQPFAQILIAGEYDIVYRRESGNLIVPVNQNAVVATLDLQGPVTLNVDITSHETSGQFLFNGSPAPASAYVRGSLELRHTSTHGLDDVVYLGDTNDQSYSRHIIAGRYGVFYQSITGTDIAPVNTDSPVPGYGNVRVNGSPIDIDIPVTVYVGTFTFNGAPPPASQYENGSVVMIDRETGAESLIGETHDGTFERAAIDGDYDLAYRVALGDNLVPLNEYKIFAREVNFPAGGQIQAVLDIDIPVTQARVIMKLDEQAWSPGAGEATIRLLEENGTLSYILGSTNDSPWQAALVSGRYRVLYSRETGTGIPINALTELPLTLNIEGDAAEVVINVPYIDLTPSALINGAPWPAGNSASLSLLTGGGLANLGTGAGAWPARRLLQGTYDVLYGFSEGGDAARNAAHRQGCVYASRCLFCDGFE